MKIVLVSKSSRIGGAAIACRRLLVALNKNGQDAKMLIQDMEKGDSIISMTNSKMKKYMNFYRFAYERFLFFVRERSKSVRFLFSLANTGENIHNHMVLKDSDIVHLHWFNQGYISLKGLKKVFQSGKPVVWTLHDMWAFTGGCHHSGTCTRYIGQCGECPFLKKPSKYDLSYRIFERKKKVFDNAPLTVVTCSNWLAEKARVSTLFKNVQVLSIPNPIDTNLFRPTDKLVAKRSFNLKKDKKYLLFGAVNVNNYFKGFTYFRDALTGLVRERPDLVNELEVIILGRSSSAILKEIPLKYFVIEAIKEESRMCELYNAVDWFVTSSLQENLPNTIMESFACGTPVIAFNVGGIPEMVEHKINGYLVEYKSIEDLEKAIIWALESADYNLLAVNARNKVLTTYEEAIVSSQYISLYGRLLNSSI